MGVQPVMPGLRIVVTAALESAAAVSFELRAINGAAPGHLLPEGAAAALLSSEVGVNNGATPGHLVR